LRHRPAPAGHHQHLGGVPGEALAVRFRSRHRRPDGRQPGRPDGAAGHGLVAGSRRHPRPGARSHPSLRVGGCRPTDLRAAGGAQQARAHHGVDRDVLPGRHARVPRARGAAREGEARAAGAGHGGRTGTSGATAQGSGGLRHLGDRADLGGPRVQDVKGKVAVVTGAASGIGNAVATRLAAEGMKVVLADIEEGPLADAEKKLADEGATVLAVPTDVTKGDQVDALAEKTFATFGTAPVVHNNAGVATGGPMWTLSEADWQWVLGVNLWGVIHGVRAFVPRMVEQAEGHVVNTASMAGLTSAPMMGPYNVSKHGVVTLSETLAAELVLFGTWPSACSTM